MPHYNTKGTCARQIIYNVENDILTDVKFIGGCSGNQQGVSRLVIGMKVDDVIDKLKGITCRNNTSCPDQLAQALADFKEKKKEG
jgi:uncharacterized protein (TIGR03905 family)